MRVPQTKRSLATGVYSDCTPDHGAQRVVNLVLDDEWEEVEGEVVCEKVQPMEVLGVEEEEEEEEDLEPLPPIRRQRTNERGEERGESSPTVGGTQVQARVVPSLGRLPSSEASRDSNPRRSRPWALGGTPVQRKVASSLGRRSRDNLSSEASHGSGSRDKRLCTEFAQEAGVPSSPPITPRGDQISLNSDTPSGALEKSVSRKYWKKEFVPGRNRRVHELSKKFLQAEVLAYHPWPNTATIEGMVRRSWGNALEAEEVERKGCYPGSGRTPNKAGPTKEPDEVSLGIVSACNTM